MPRYYLRVSVTLLINIINQPFRSYERKFINPKIEKRSTGEDPIFILGHWRSGTTHLHNLLNQDPRMGAVTTYQVVFPDTLFNTTGYFIFKNFMRLLIAPRRLGDNVKMNADFPQEEEFAIGSRYPLCFYYFWIFPENTLDFYRQCIEFQNVDKKSYLQWQDDYRLIIKKAIQYKNGATRFLSKNPTNTGRIGALLEMFPNARFIHIYRNPVTVFLSTLHFYHKMMPALQLHTVTEEQLEEIIFSVYDQLMHKYLDDRKLIPPENLLEFPFEALEKDPLGILQMVYSKFKLPDYESVKESFASYYQQSKGYRKNVHHISRQQLGRILDRWDFAMKEWGYQVPADDLVISQD
ncbi:MAG: sulfotransferase [Bacteroidales bacterium]|nr:sulfotransferase [Lentimicrobiaceae bacterium]MDD5695253.1 sulfotransferase [Bacteroidales bacterium]